MKDKLIRLGTVNLDCPDAQQLSAFYLRLLDWRLHWDEGDFVIIEDPEGGTRLSFQTEPCYVPPVWPDEPGKPGKSMHLDLRVSDLERARDHALACGARLAPQQYYEGVLVFFDPAGHPFCLF